MHKTTHVGVLRGQCLSTHHPAQKSCLQALKSLQLPKKQPPGGHRGWQRALAAPRRETTRPSGQRSGPSTPSSLHQSSVLANLPSALKSFQTPKKQPPGVQGEGHRWPFKVRPHMLEWSDVCTHHALLPPEVKSSDKLPPALKSFKVPKKQPPGT